jgi:hypothetical protein
MLGEIGGEKDEDEEEQIDSNDDGSDTNAAINQVDRDRSGLDSLCPFTKMMIHGKAFELASLIDNFDRFPVMNYRIHPFHGPSRMSLRIFHSVRYINRQYQI